MARICIVSPGQLATNPRLVKEATTLSNEGHDVTVVIGLFSQWADPIEYSIITAQWSVAARVPFGSLASLSLRIKQGVRQRLAGILAFIGFHTEWVAISAAHPASIELLRETSKINADLYIGHYVAALPAVAIAARRHGALYAFDAEDFHPGDPPEGAEGEYERGLTQAIESRFLPDCTYVTAASPGIADAYARTYAIPRPTVVLNVFPLAQAPNGPTLKGATEPGPSVYWFSQTIGPDRGLECAVQAIASARSKPHLYLRGTPAPGFVKDLRQLAENEGVAEHLHILPPAIPEQMERLASEYDVGLVAETGHTLNRRIALTNKQFTYLLAGIPSIMSDVPAHREFVQGGSLALHLYTNGDAQSLSRALDTLLLDSALLKAARYEAYRLGQEIYNWEKEQRHLGEIVATSLTDDTNNEPTGAT